MNRSFLHFFDCLLCVHLSTIIIIIIIDLQIEETVIFFIWKSNVIWWLSILFAIVATFCIHIHEQHRTEQIAMKVMYIVHAKSQIARHAINYQFSKKKLFLDMYHCNAV